MLFLFSILARYVISMKKESLLFCLLISIMVSSCEKDDNSSIRFSGITVRDESALLISEDLNDWQLHSNWSDQEHSLFNEKRNLDCDTTTEEYSILAYPNPCNGIFYLGLTKPLNKWMSLRIVDEDFNVLVSSDSVFSEVLAFNLTSFNRRDQLVRVYYKFLGENCELKGHGDIKIE